MTQVAQIFEEEKRQEVEQVKRQAERALKKEQEEKRQIVIKMIQKNYSVDEIVSLVSSYSQNDVEKLRREIVEN